MKKFAIILLAVSLVASVALADKLSDLHGPTNYVPLQAEGLILAIGDDCTDPITIGSADLPYSDMGNTTCGRGNNYEETCLLGYDGGEDIIYMLTLDADTEIDILAVTDASWVGLAIFDDCPDVGVCIATSTSSSGTQSLSGLALTAGTYYIMVDTWPTPDCIPTLDFSISPAAPPQPGDTCESAVPAVEGLNSCSGAEFWYTFTAPIDGCIWFNSCIEGQSVDTYVRVYSDCDGTLLDQNDDAENCEYYGFATFLSLPVTAGDVLYILWDDNYSTDPFDWNLWVTDCIVSTEDTSWGSLKTLFR
jgi:hypothetical protein